MANEGMHVKSGMELFQLSDISRIWVLADIYEYELPWLREGQGAVVELPYAPDKPLSGKVTYIYPYVEDKTRTVKVRMEFENPGYMLKPDMYVNVELAARTVKDTLVIPREAVLHSGDRETVFVALEDGKFEPRRVRTGLQGGEGLIQIKQGVLEGERVVTSAQFLLDSESQLREAIQKMLEPKKAEPATKQGTGKESMEDLFGDDSGGSGAESKKELEDLF
jgi:RND family efflux transporter MFP subunit